MSLELRDDVTGTYRRSHDGVTESYSAAENTLHRSLKIFEWRSRTRTTELSRANGDDNAQKTKRSEPLRSSNPGLINPFSDLTEVMSMRPRRQCSLGRRVDWLDDADAMTIMSELCPPADSATLARCTGWC